MKPSHFSPTSLGFSLTRDELFYLLNAQRRGKDPEPIRQEIWLGKITSFFADRPALSKEKFCEEAKISISDMDQVLSRQKSLTQSFIDKIHPLISKYGGRF